MIREKRFPKICFIIIVLALFLTFVLNYVRGTVHANNLDLWISFLGSFSGAGVALLLGYYQIDQEKKKN